MKNNDISKLRLDSESTLSVRHGKDHYVWWKSPVTGRALRGSTRSRDGWDVLHRVAQQSEMSAEKLLGLYDVGVYSDHVVVKG
jgi:hypothetical protein